jgi:Holliday junction resolvasome RuvABC endonuclease subunit
MRLKTFGLGYSNNVDLYVGIDQSYSGFAITILGSDSSYETTVAKFDSGGVSRLSEIQEHLRNTLSDAVVRGVVKDVAMEGYAYGREFGVAQSGELGGAVKLALYDMDNIGKGNYPLIVAPTSLKKYVTGRGNGIQKNQMLLNVFKKWNVEFSDDNAADSYGLAHIASGKGKMAYEKEIYDKLQTADSREK